MWLKISPIVCYIDTNNFQQCCIKFSGHTTPGDQSWICTWWRIYFFWLYGCLAKCRPVHCYSLARLCKSVNTHNSLTLTVSPYTSAFSGLFGFFPWSNLPSLSFFPPATVHNASESNYPIYMQSGASDAFATAVPRRSRDGRQRWAGGQSK